jgi:hypothetical protein
LCIGQTNLERLASWLHCSDNADAGGDGQVRWK